MLCPDVWQPVCVPSPADQGSRRFILRRPYQAGDMLKGFVCGQIHCLVIGELGEVLPSEVIQVTLCDVQRLVAAVCTETPLLAWGLMLL